MNTVAYRNLILAAAVLAIGTTPALAQGTTTRLKAEVPFSFRVGGLQYPAGTYMTSVLVMNTGVRAIKIVNVQSGEPTIVLASSVIYPGTNAQQDGGARLTFRCAESNCSLAQLWAGSGEPGIQFLTPTVKRGESMKLAVIRLRPTAAD